MYPNLRRTSRSVNEYVVSNRRRLVGRGIGAVRISEEFDEATKTSEYTVQVVKWRLGQQKLFLGCLDLTFKINEPKKIKVRPTNSPFFHWFTKKFANTVIGVLDFHKFRLKREEVDELPALLKISKLTTTEMLLTENTFIEEEHNLIPSFLNKMRPEELYIHCRDQIEIRKLVTPQFYEMTFSWLNYLTFPNYKDVLPSLGDRVEEIAESVDRFPKTIFALYGEIIPLEAVQRALQVWWRGDTEVDTWLIQLPAKYFDIDFLAASLGFPHNFGVQYYTNIRQIELCRPCGGKKMVIRIGELHMKTRFTTGK